ncbi:MAG: glycosyltransferase family 4 protein [Ignavibacteria bacterium]|nr:glycosyltransferase family 4 protein [Ignavibacteria bacterium]
MTKVLILSTVHKINDVRIFYKEAKSLKKLNCEIYYAVQHEELSEFSIDEIKILPLPKAKNEFDRITKVQYYAFRKILKIKPDIIHFHDPELIPMVSICKLLFKSKVIFDIHENIVGSIDEKTYLNSFTKKMLKFIFPKIEKLFIKNFEAKIIAEKSYAEIYRENVIEILNYPILTTQKISEKNFKSELNFIYSGSITELRGIFQTLDIFLDILKETKISHKLHLVGDFYPESLRSEIILFCKKNNIEENVVIYGRIPLEKIYEILRECHIGFSLLAPIKNHIASLPTKIFEYMLFGLPVIVSDFEIYNNYIIQNDTGITVDYSDSQKSSKMIINMIRDVNHLYIMSENGRNSVQNKWNWNSEEKKLLNLYEKLLN